MVVRARSVAFVLSGMAALPLGAHATANLPSFSCDSSSGIVNGVTWGDGAHLGEPTIILPQNKLQLHFPCSALLKTTESQSVQGTSFAVNFGDFTESGIELKDGLTYHLALNVYDYQVEFKSPSGMVPEYFSNFDLYINLMNFEGKLQTQEFVGVKLDSFYGYAAGGQFVVLSNGTVQLDPTIPGGSGQLELYSAPVAPSSPPPPSVPEPATLVLVGSGLLGGVLRRKRRPRT